MMFELLQEDENFSFHVICSRKKCDWQKIVFAKNRKTAKEIALNSHEDFEKHKPLFKIKKEKI